VPLFAFTSFWLTLPQCALTVRRQEMEMKNGSSMRLTPAQSGFRLLDTTFYRFPLKALFGKFFTSSGFGFTKKNSTSHWDGGAFQKQIRTDLAHCDLFQWLKKIFTPLRLTPITLGLSVRDQVGSCFKSGPLVLSVQWELNFSKIH